jgi:hypothetical protein
MRALITTTLLLSIFLASQAQALVLWEVESQYFSAVFQTEGAYKYAPEGVSSYEDTKILSFYVTKSFNEKYMPLGDWKVSGSLNFRFGESITNVDPYGYWDLDPDEPFPHDFSIRGSREIDLFTNSQGDLITEVVSWGFGNRDVVRNHRIGGNLEFMESCENDLRHFDSIGLDVTKCRFIAGGSPPADVRYVRDQKDWRKVEVSEPPMLPLLMVPLIALAFLRLKKKLELSNFTPKRI